MVLRVAERSLPESVLASAVEEQAPLGAAAQTASASVHWRSDQTKPVALLTACPALLSIPVRTAELMVLPRRMAVAVRMLASR